jgi:hypothetical protein
MADRQQGELLVMGGKEGIAYDNKRVHLKLDQGRKSVIGIAVGTCSQNMELQRKGACRRLCISSVTLGGWTVGVYEEADFSGLWN